MRGTLIFLVTIVIGYLTPGIRGDGHLTRPTATNISITRTGCGDTKLCVGAEDCDPAGNVLCPFASSQLVNNSTVDLAIELFGNASGYIALVLSSDVTQGGGTVFICSRDRFNATRNFFFRTATQNGRDGNITLVNTPRVDSITYNFNRSINGSFHQCSFTVRNLTQSASNRATGPMFQPSIVTGEANADGSFQAPTELFRSAGLLNVADPTAIISTTASPNTTATTTTTTPPPPRPTATNISITRTGCGDTKLCVGAEDCDPAGNVLCPFASSRLVNASTLDLAIELFGNASGYIALVLSSVVNQGGGTVFVCSRDPFNANRNFFFRTATQNGDDGNITLVNTPRVDSITYNFNRSINGSFHQCSFTVRNLIESVSTRNTGLNLQVSIVTGEVNADGTFQVPTSRLFRSSGLLNVTNPMANVATTASPNTTAPATTMSGCSSLLQPLTQAIAILVSALALRLF